MTVVPTEKEDLVKDIQGMLSGSPEQMLLVAYYGLVGYFKSLFAFGRKSTVTRDNLKIIKEMWKILREEEKLLNFILKNIWNVDVDAATKVVAMLDDLNDKTVEYYYKVMEDIEDACETKDEHRGKRPNQGFDSLIQTRRYANQVVALAENMEDIRKFLGYEEDFWKFIKPLAKVSNADVSIVGGMFYVTPIYDQDWNVSTIKMLVPKVVDLPSALLCIKLYEEAYRIYKSLGKPYEKSAIVDIAMRLKYESEYLPEKTEKSLK